MRKNIAIIGGTGMKELFESSMIEGFGYHKQAQWIERKRNRYGSVPVTIQDVEKEGQAYRLQFLHRHHGIGTTPPHAINYHANVRSVGDFQPEVVVTVQSVGSLHRNFPPGMLGLVKDYIDFTGRVSTFHNDTAVHTDLFGHFSREHRPKLVDLLASQSEDDLELELIVAQMTGPQFESPAEIRALQIMGATAVGMTLVPEAKLIAELDIPQVALVVSSNWGSGFDPRGDVEIDHHKVEARAKQLHALIWRSIVTVMENL